jgi:DNA-binding transcriptional ArsR family regulator
MDIMSFISAKKWEEASRTTSELISFLNVGVIGGYVSVMNRDVLLAECASIRDVIEENRDSIQKSHRNQFQKDFFRVPESYSAPPTAREETLVWGSELWRELDKGQKDKKTLKRFGIGGSILQSRKGQDPTYSKTERRNIILDFVRKNNTVTVKDISSAVSGYSTKTIQRELSLLVSEGVLKKEGERRWSTYRLA